MNKQKINYLKKKKRKMFNKQRLTKIVHFSLTKK